MDNLFVDRLGNVMVTNGVARLEFLTVKEINTKNNQASLESACRLHMPVDGILQAIEILEKMKADLESMESSKQQQKEQQHKPQQQAVEPAPQKTPKRKLTKEEFKKLPPEQQAKIRKLIKEREQEKLRQKLSR